MNKFINMIKQLKDTISNVQEISENYVKNLPMYSVLQNKIDKVQNVNLKSIFFLILINNYYYR